MDINLKNKLVLLEYFEGQIINCVRRVSWSKLLFCRRDGNTLDDPELHHADADAATEQLSQALQSSHEFDKMAFQAVTSAIEDLQKKGILTISENNTNEAASFHLNANASKFFMTDHQTHTYAHQDFDVQPSSSEGVEDELRAEVMPSSTNNQAEMSTAYSV